MIDKWTAISNPKTLGDFLLDKSQEGYVSFHMPGHKGRRFFESLGLGDRLETLVEGDITEIPGADNLFDARGPIRSLMDRYRNIYGSKESFLLVGGASAGLVASILTVGAPGDKFIVARNAHQSVINGLELAGCQGIYVLPEYIPAWDIVGEVKAEDIATALAEHPESKGVIITNPSYQGICSDMAGIAEAVHAAGKVLIVDQAHGAHLGLMKSCGLEGLQPAEEAGADIVVMSTHKTMASFTQTALAHIYGDKVDIDEFAHKLQMIESSSPSYILMSSLDMNAEIMEEHGEELGRRWLDCLREFYREAERVEGLSVLNYPGRDISKIVFSIDGISGSRAEELLIRRGIYTEMNWGDMVVALSGIGNTPEDYKKLLEALKEMARVNQEKSCGALSQASGSAATHKAAAGGRSPICVGDYGELLNKLPRQISQEELIGLRRGSKKERVFWKEAAERLCAEAVIPYPPGTPVYLPGEIFDDRGLALLAAMKEEGHTVMGMDDELRLLCFKS